MAPVSLSRQTARNLHLAAQGLLHAPKRKATYHDLLTTIRRMSLLQIDTIHVVARSPYLVLFSRLGDYPIAWLEQALASGSLFEYWAHEACFIPAEDYPLLRHRMLQPEKMGWKYSATWMAEHADEVARLLQHIAAHGPVRSADFATAPGHQPGWWSWKPHKRHLENLFTAGELMVVGRQNFQRIYDLRQRVLPEWNDALHMLSEEEAQEQMLRNSARSLGIFRAEWLPDYYRLKRVALKNLMARWQEEGFAVPVMAEDMGAMWLHHEALAQLEKPLKASHTAILSPFDPVVWDRRRALALFDFNYRLECYTPEAKRRYGYFTLPLLHRGALKARLDAKMLRRERCLEIKNFWLEEKISVSAGMLNDLRKAIARFARWQGAEQVRIEKGPAMLLQGIGTHWSLTNEA
ncbi:winged helix-turn-helix domain-containing protein [Mixta hanseatica]|uniref:Winged helix-turn-helix domain-containing protein n=1 Tax=Mixta hanseatica TaxID=2872648 RepID=A0ABY4RG18_9GAMM|nr:winged helix-turn-helix domain-containing protein [Mixta hanseatica]UQY45559.1 winged helix-turn-helix domain-containing protein [Mixta hanseatica]